MEKTCPSCHIPVLESWYFCQNCAKKLRTKPASTTIAAQIGIYALSIFLPPLGLWPGLTYLFQKENKAKIIGVIALVLTIIATIVTVYYAVQIMDSVNKAVNEQLNSAIGF